MKKYIKLFYVYKGKKINIGLTSYSIFFTIRNGNKNNKSIYNKINILYLCYCGLEPYYEFKFGLHDELVYEDQNMKKILFKLGLDGEL